MSTLLRIFLMALAWLLFTLLTFYTCVQPQCCTGTEVVEEVPVTPPAVTDDYAIVSKLGADEVLTGSQWAALRDQLVAHFRDNPGEKLDIYGHYYATETTPDGYENMGFLRAENIRDLLVAQTDIPAEATNLLSRRLDDATPGADDLWRAGTFNWNDAGDDGPPIVELDKDEIIIRFPFDEATNSLPAETSDYLDKLAQRLQQTEETVVITGHTDNVDTDAYNQALGQQRADFVKRILVQDGAPAARITTRSEGESNPTATNATSAGRAQNRRAVVKLRAVTAN